jgi:predicted phosphodiesterase
VAGKLVTWDQVRKVAPWAGLVVLWLVVAVSVGLLAFATDTKRVTIGAHTTQVSPTFDGYVTLDPGTALPRMRLRIDLPLGVGVNVDVQETDARDLTDLLTRDALIASQPEGEIQRIREVVEQTAVDSAIAGAGSGTFAAVLAVAAWKAVGQRRRSELVGMIRRRPHPAELRLAGVLLAMLIAAASVVLPGRLRPADAEPAEWRPLAELLPEVRLDPRLARVEAATGFSTTGGIGLIRSAVDTYERSTEFYGNLRERVHPAAPQLRQPSPGETVAMLISDRHNNIGMDPVAAEVAKAAGATVLIDAGDDTSAGERWEVFSINSLAEHFQDLKIVAVAGNHDAGGHVTDAMKRHEFTVLEGKPVEVEGIRFLGDSDPTSTGLGSSDEPGKETTAEQGTRLADVACEQDDDDRIATVVVHDPSSGAETATRGCATLVVSGHLHRQVGPATSRVDGSPVTTYTNGTTGGAAYAFALGYTLRRPAQVTLITYDEGQPIGLQPVTFELTGDVTVGAYRPIATR